MSETAGGFSMNCQGAWGVGSVGRPLPGTETRISEETGEARRAQARRCGRRSVDGGIYLLCF